MHDPDRLPGILVLVAFAACAPAERDARVAEVRDSLGVMIVEYPAESIDTVRAQPLLTIGSEDDPNYQFYRVAGVQGLSDGRIVVADAGSQQVRYYTTEGDHILSLGGEGDGPGEFRFMNDVQLLPGDTVAVNDARQREVSFFDPSPAFAGRHSNVDKLDNAPPDNDGPCAFPGYAGLVWPRTSVLLGWACVQGEGREGLRHYEASVSVWPRVAGEPVEIGPLMVGSAWERPDLDVRNRFRFLRVAERQSMEVSFDAIYLTIPGRREVHRLNPDGSLLSIIRDHLPRRPVGADVGRAIAELHEDETGDIALPDSLPAFDRIVIGDATLWLRHTELPIDEATYWTAYSRHGQSRSIVAFPTGFDLMSVRDGRAYGAARDELDIERIQVFEVGPNSEPVDEPPQGS